MAHRKDRKEALRLERERREAEARAARQRKRLVGYGAAAVLAIAAVGIVIVLAAGGGSGGGGAKGGGDVFPSGGSVPKQKVFDLQKAAVGAGCVLKSSKGSGVATHTQSLDVKIKYNDNPPTNGRHYVIPADDGLYQKAPKDEQLVHNLEHGRVDVWVKPSLPADVRKQIRALFDEDSYQMVVVPRPNMPYAIAATAWSRDPTPGGTGRTLGCPQFNEKVIDAIRAFRDEHRSNGPEPIP